MNTPDLVVDSTETVWKRRTQLDVVTFRNRRFDGSMSQPRTWEVWRRGHAVGVLPYDPVADCLVMIEQFRFPAHLAGLPPMMLEIPGGFRDEGEPAIGTAGREMREETGLGCDRYADAGTFVLSAGGSDETVQILAGRIQAPQAGPDGIVGYGGLDSENEDIRVRVLPAAEAIAGAVAGRHQNVITAVALLWFAARRDWLREQWA